MHDYTLTEQPHAIDVDGNEIVPNAFNVSRAYLNVAGTLSRVVVAFRLTPDVVRETGEGSSAVGWASRP